MSDILKEIFGTFAEASRIGMRLQQQADAEMKWERTAAEVRDRAARKREFDKRRTRRMEIDESQPWNDDLNPQ